MRNLQENEVQQLIAQHCDATDWQLIEVCDDFSPAYIQNVHFSGRNVIGRFTDSYTLPGGLKVHSGIFNATLHNCELEDNVRLYNIYNYIANYHISSGTCIENVNAVLVSERSKFGNGVRVPVLNEGGGREIPIYDRLSAQTAYVMTLYRHRPQMLKMLEQMVDEYAEQKASDMGFIGHNARIVNCGIIKNCYVGDFTELTGVSSLKNGSINSNEFAPVHIGSGVKCKDFIVSSGVSISDSTLIERCFVGQGCIFDKHYSALDSLFFSNCQGMHGEATAIFAGPYTVSHHKSTLLIAGMFSFLNAGSGSNQSNHLYKLGPIHQGIAERGAKTTSDSYLLWPAKIGTFTLVMGRHTKHSDTSLLPFSYLIENGTESYLVPGVNIRSVGTIRDAQKWPKRDNRKDPDKLDCINFNLLSPYTIQKMWAGRDLLLHLKSISGATTDEYTYQNCRIRRSSLEKGIEFYTIGIRKFLGNSLISRLQSGKNLTPDVELGDGEWVDCAGMIAPKKAISDVLDRVEKGELTLGDIEQAWRNIHANYYSYEWTWALKHLEKVWGCSYKDVTKQQLQRTILEWKQAVVSLDKMIYQDAQKEFDMTVQTGFGADGGDEIKRLDFEQVRGTFDSNPIVLEILNHIDRKSALADEAMKLI